MAVQFTPPHDIDDQAEIDRLRAARVAPPDFSADPTTLSPEQRQRIGRLAFKWFFIRVLFWTPLIAPVSLLAGWLTFVLTATGALGDQGLGMAWFGAICIGIAAACYVVRCLGGMAAFRGPLRLRRGGAPRNLLEATAGGVFNGLSSIYCAYVVFFYGVGILIIIGLLSPVQPPPVG